MVKFVTLDFKKIDVLFQPLWVSSKDIAGALVALAVDSVAPVSLLAPLALGALGEEEALEALPGVGVAVPLRRAVPVVGAVASLAHPAWQLGVAVEVVSTDVAPAARASEIWIC